MKKIIKKNNYLLLLLATCLIAVYGKSVIINAAEKHTSPGVVKETATLLDYNNQDDYYANRGFSDGDWYKFETPSTPGYTEIYFKNTNMNDYAQIELMTVVEESLYHDKWIGKNNYTNNHSYLEPNRTYYIKVEGGTENGIYLLGLNFTEDKEGNSKETGLVVDMDKEYTWSMDGYPDYDYGIFEAKKSGKHLFQFKNLSVDKYLDVEIFKYNTDERITYGSWRNKGNSYIETLDLEKNQKYYFKIGEGDVTGNYSVIIKSQNVDKVTINKTVLNIKAGDSARLKATVSPTNAYDTSVTWKSSNTDVAYIDKEGNIRTYKPGKAIITCTANDGNGAVSTAEVIVKPTKIENLYTSVDKATTKSFNMNWYGKDGASGYTIYAYDTKTKKYVAIKSVNKNKTNFKVKQVKVNGVFTPLKAGTTYKMKVAPYVTIEGKKHYGARSGVFNYTTNPAKTKITNIKSSKERITINWSKVNGATGYKIYVKRPGANSYSYVQNVSSSTRKYAYSYKTYFYRNSGKYSFVVTPYKVIKTHNVTYTGTNSAEKSVTVR